MVKHMSRLTHRKKMVYFQLIVERDEYKCFYCEEVFSDNHPPEYDHLNNNPEDSRPENIVLTHRECNNKKKFSTDWQIKAHDKLEQNERAVLACERRLADTGSTEELTSSQQISKALRPIALQWLEEHSLIEKDILLKDAINAIVFLCQKQTGWGSTATIYRYFDEWCNPYYGKYTFSRNEAGKIIIRRRNEK